MAGSEKVLEKRYEGSGIFVCKSVRTLNLAQPCTTGRWWLAV